MSTNKRTSLWPVLSVTALGYIALSAQLDVGVPIRASALAPSMQTWTASSQRMQPPSNQGSSRPDLGSWNDHESVSSSTIIERPSWDSAYEGSPPWDIGRPQPAFVELARAGKLQGEVLDVGCGTGEQTLLAAKHGAQATGVDIAKRAIQRARAKAEERGIRAAFETADALHLDRLVVDRVNRAGRVPRRARTRSSPSLAGNDAAPGGVTSVRGGRAQTVRALSMGDYDGAIPE